MFENNRKPLFEFFRGWLEEVTITGVLTRMQWTNPHSRLYMDVKDKDGSVVAWTFEGYPSVVVTRSHGSSPLTC